jgi:hypothetical protein
MPEFKIKAKYYGEKRKGIFFREKEPVDFHCFSIENIDELPGEYFPPSSVLRNKNEKGWENFWETIIYCWLFISENLSQKLNLNFEKDKSYQFVVRLGEPKAAKFIATEIEKGYEHEEYQLVLKTQQYFENTVQKIGFWGSKNYFYEANKKQNNNNQSQSENKKFWVKVAWICFPILFFFSLC